MCIQSNKYLYRYVWCVCIYNHRHNLPGTFIFMSRILNICMLVIFLERSRQGYLCVCKRGEKKVNFAKVSDKKSLSEK